MKKAIAKTMYNIMIETDKKYIWYGDLNLIEQCAQKCQFSDIHPKKKIQRILNALEHSDLFQKKYLYSDITGQNRKYRCFKIKF